MSRFRKKPVEIDAVQWTGTNQAGLSEFTEGKFEGAYAAGWLNADDSEMTAAVFDELHDTWVPLRTGDWVIKGITGEFYPCRASVFEATYEEVID